MFKHNWLFLVVVAAVLSLGMSVSWAQEGPVPPEAMATVDRLFKLLDAGKVKETYDLTAPVVKNAGSQALWTGQVQSWRDPVGELVSRKLESSEPVTSYADLPDGDYLKIVYQSVFSRQAETKEILILASEPGGTFAIARYEVQFNRWPEAIQIIYTGLFFVFMIMSLLATITWAVGRTVQSMEKKSKEKAKDAEKAGKGKS